MIRVFHHIDEDGRCAASIVAHFCGAENCEFYPINYGNKFPIDEVVFGETVYIVDFSLEPSDMEALLMKTHNIIWIDHHITAINKYQDFDKSNIIGIQEDGTAGCVLTWRWFAGESKQTPDFIKYVGDWDVWKFQYGDVTREFYRGLSIYDQNPASGIWADLFDGKITVDAIRADGKTIIKYDEIRYANMCKFKGFDAKIEGFEDVRVFALNMPGIGSDAFASVDASQYDVFCGFSFDGEKFVYSLRSSNGYDCTEIAASDIYKGGGHKGAAGFSYNRMVITKR